MSKALLSKALLSKALLSKALLSKALLSKALLSKVRRIRSHEATAVRLAAVVVLGLTAACGGIRTPHPAPSRSSHAGPRGRRHDRPLGRPEIPPNVHTSTTGG